MRHAPFPTPLGSCFEATNLFKRQDSVLAFVNNYTDCYFIYHGKVATRFDLISVNPGVRYKTSWKTLSEKSSILPELARARRWGHFGQALGQIFDGIRPAISGNMEAIVLISFWRICRHFLDASDVYEDRQHRKLIFALLKYLRKVTPKNVPQLRPLAQLFGTLCTTPSDEVTVLLQLGYLRSIHSLKSRFEERNFTIPQMATNYLTQWDMAPARFPGMITDFERIVVHTNDEFGPLDWRTLLCLHQFLCFTVTVQNDQATSLQVAENLHSRTRTLLTSADEKFNWDSVASAFKYATGVLIKLHSRGPDIRKASTYLDDALLILRKGDIMCQRQAQILADSVPCVSR
jgi:hypothetical protein